MNQPTPTLTASLTPGENALRVLWSLANPAAEGLYVCVRANIGNQLLTAPYTYLSEGDSVLTATFRWLAAPPNVDVTAVDLPFYRLLEAGQTAEEKSELALPIRELHPYGNRKYPEKPVPVQVSRIAFSVECFWSRDALFARETRLDPELVQAKSERPLYLEKLFTLDRPVTLLKRTDRFFRYSPAELALPPRPENGLSQRRP
jgi:hypothetical protein